MSDDASFVLQTLKQLDPENYLSVLYLPEAIRNDIALLWAFDAEISRIPDLVSEPMPGEIRLQWWRDLIQSGGNAGSGPLARQLIAVIEKHNLLRETFHTYLEARIFDLYQDPMPDMGTLEGYLGETVSVFFQNAALVAGAKRSAELADAAGHAGMAVGICRLLSNAAKHRNKGQIFFPLDGLEPEQWLGEQVTHGHISHVSKYADIATEHLVEARAAISKLPAESRGVFLLICFVDPLLKLVRKDQARCLQHPVSLSSLKRQWTILRAAMRDIP